MNFENIEKVKRSKPFTVIDIVLAVIIAAAIGAAFWGIYRTPPRTVSVTVDGVSTDYDLYTDRTIDLGRLVVNIQGGSVWVTGADCPDKTCENTGRIGRAGESIVCLPNGIVITIGGESDLQWGIG